MFPAEALVPIEFSQRQVIGEAVRYLDDYGRSVLEERGFSRGRVKVSFYDLNNHPEAQATLLVDRGRAGPLPLRFHCVESGVEGLKLDQVDLGLTDRGMAVKPVVDKGKPAPLVASRDRKIIVDRLLQVVKHDFPVIAVERPSAQKGKWILLKQKPLASPLELYAQPLTIA